MGKKKLKESYKAYIAGFLDGDGSIHASIEPRIDLRLKFRVLVSVDFTQDLAHESQLSYLKRLIGFGFITKTQKSRKSCKLVIKKREKVKELLENVKPYVFAKRKQLDLALKIINLYSFSSYQNLRKTANLADKISKLNISTRSRRKNYASILKASSPVTTDSRIAG